MIEGVGAVSAISQAFLAPQTTTAQPVGDPEAVKAFNYSLQVRETESSDWQEVRTPAAAEFNRNDGSIGSGLIQAITEMDANYRDAISRIQNWPGFGAYLEKHGVTLGTEDTPKSSAYRHVSNVAEVDAARSETRVDAAQMLEQGISKMNEIQAKSQAYYNAGMEYEYDSAKWFLTTEFWMTKVKILTSAVTQVSNSLRTLFNSQ